MLVKVSCTENNHNLVLRPLFDPYVYKQTIFATVSRILYANELCCDWLNSRELLSAIFVTFL